MRSPGLIALPLMAALLSAVAFAETPAPGGRGIPPDEPRPGQRVANEPPPAAPEATPADPGAPLPPLPPIPPDPVLQTRREHYDAAAALPPPQFNPDPGADRRPAADDLGPYFTTHQVNLPRPEDEPLPPGLALPRGPLDRPVLESAPPTSQPAYGLDPLPPGLALPRSDVRENTHVGSGWHAPERYPLSEYDVGVPAHAAPVPDRWRHTGFVPWRRYTSGDTNELTYWHPDTELWHPYRQSLLKGDIPVHGQDVFLAVAVSGEAVYENRKLTVPSGASAAQPGAFDFFGKSRSDVLVTNLALDLLLFQGETVFKPVEWAVKLRPVFNYNHVRFHETGLVFPDPSGPTVDRERTYVALQEAFVEVHLHDLSPTYDFVAVKAGNQTFNSDFRGFIFNDTNLGVRLFGNADANRWQYNLALFDMREKDTNSELNTFESRDQRVFIANLYRQDFLTKGYTAQLSFHANLDDGGTHYDENGFIVRPAPLGTVEPHRVQAYYLGWAGDGHFGRWNLSHAAYLALGRDELNGLAGQPVDIFGHMAAAELSYDRDWIRYKASVFYASGDSDPEDGRATGFDSIVDNANFTGGPFSYYVRQGFNLAGTAVALKQRFSLLPNLRTSKTQGQANFVNPGVIVLGLGSDIEVTPRVRAFLSANHIRFAATDPIETALFVDDIDPEFGTDLGLGLQWRPFLTDNVIVSLGFGALLPGRGFRDIFRTAQPSPSGASPRVDDWLHSGSAAVIFTY